VIVLAAGGGTRMRSRVTKLLHLVAGRSMVSHAVNAAEEVRPDRLVVVVGHQRDQVLEHLAEVAPQVITVVQEEQLGTGHAVQVAMSVLASQATLTGEVVVTYGDVPLLTGQTLQQLVDFHRSQADAITVLTAALPDPTGYGRVVRGADGQVTSIVEHRDADEATLAIDEINSGVYVFDAAVLVDGLGRLGNDNAQREYYLADVLSIAVGDGRRVGAWQTDDLWQTEGVNDRAQLSRVSAEMNRRICERWMHDGVTMVDPATTWITGDVTLATDVTLLPGTSLQGATTVGEGSIIGPETTLIDCEVGADAIVVRAHAQLAVIGDRASVGPYAYLRPGTQLATGSKIGTFVEAKNAQLGAGAKVPHLTYCGDAVIGAQANIGAGTIFANYDGMHKHTSTVGEASFVGSNSVLCAPVNIADGAYVAAGSALTGDVDPGQLAVSRARQRNIDGWVQRKRAGTQTAAAAERAINEGRTNDPGDESEPSR